MPEKILSVFEFNTIADQLLKQNLGHVTVQGEVSGFKTSQGKFAYFDIKDTQSVLNCFAMTFRLDFPLEDGQEVVITGTPGIYLKGGRFSLNVESIRLHGEGNLQKAFLELTKKLETEGLFAPTHKQPLPRFPEHIGVITSGDGAAINDIRKVINGRWGGIKLSLIPVAVQGQNAVDELVGALNYFNQYQPVDVIIFGRGGGSLEDLQAFNAERVARAIFASRIPIISGVGHEHNTSIADLVADVRAATPSNAAEIAVPDRRELKNHIAYLKQHSQQSITQNIKRHHNHLERHQSALQLFITHQMHQIRALITKLEQTFKQSRSRLSLAAKDIAQVKQQLTATLHQLHVQGKQTLHEYRRVLSALNPSGILARGYSISYSATSSSVIGSIAQLPPDGRIKTQLTDGSFESTTHLAPPPKPVIKPKVTDETRQTTLI